MLRTHPSYGARVTAMQKIRAVVIVLSLTGAAILLAGCGSASNTVTVVQTVTDRVAPEVPPPPIGRLLRQNYRAQSVFRANLTGGAVPEVIVTSVGPPTGNLNFHPANLQVLSWDNLAKRWSGIFDAQRVTATGLGGVQASNDQPGNRDYESEPVPILDPEADVQLGPVRFASLLQGKRKQLLFSATLNYGGSGVPTTFVIADFKDGVANVIYIWDGEGLESWQVDGKEIKARAFYWTPADAHCCPSRRYRFTLAQQGGYSGITAIADDRPFLGVVVRQRSGPGVTQPLQVVDIGEQAPAAGLLHAGDLILDVVNAPAPTPDGQPESNSSIYNKLTRFKAGQIARLLIERGGAQTTVDVKLGSLLDSSASSLIVPADDFTLNAL